MPWLDQYLMNVKEIDEQHSHFVAMINDLNDAMEIGSEDIVLGDIIKQIINYANYHFATEEKYFDQFHYEFTEEHKKQHQAIKDRLTLFIQEYSKNPSHTARKLMEFLKKWFTEHTQGHDKKYVDCFHENGLN